MELRPLLNPLSDIAPNRFRLGRWLVDVDANSLRSDDEEVLLEPRVMNLLQYFCTHPGTTLGKDDILQNVWGSLHFADSVLARAVSILRSALGDDAGNPAYIRTVARRGYQLICDVEPLSADDAAYAPPGATFPHDTEQSHRQHWPSAMNNRGGLHAYLIMLLIAVILLALYRGQSRDEQGQLVHADTGSQLQSIAVVPFRLYSTTDSFDYLAESLHDDIAMQLARYSEPRVYLVSASGTESDISLGSKLGADAVLSGAVQVDDESILVSLRLLDSQTSELLWASDYSDRLARTFQIRQNIVHALVSRARSGIEDIGRRSFSQPDVNPEAYQRYLKARWLWHRRSVDDLKRAHQLFLNVTELDPGFADGFAGLALSHMTLVSYSNQDRQHGYEAAALAASRALELDPDNAMALTARAQVMYQRDWNFDAAITDLKLAIDRSPGAIDSRQYLSELYSIVGEHQRAIDTIDEALQLDPYSPLLHGVSGIVHNAAGRHDDVAGILENVTAYEGRFIWHLRHQAYAESRLGDITGSAMTRLSEFRGLFSDSEYQAMRDAIELDGVDAYWRWRRSQFSEKRAARTGLSMIRFAEILLAHDEHDQAMRWIEASMEYRGESYLMTRMSPQFDKIRQRPDYLELLQRHGLKAYRPEDSVPSEQR